MTTPSNRRARGGAGVASPSRVTPSAASTPKVSFGVREDPHAAREAREKERADRRANRARELEDAKNAGEPEFAWLRGDMEDDRPYYLQGDPELHNDENTAKRQALKRHSAVEDAINRWWAMFDKTENMEVSKDDYINFLVRICKMVIPDFDEAEARRTAEEDWVRDSHGASALSFNAFFDAFFELADIWCPDIDGDEYAEFLNMLRTRLTVMVVHKKDGTVERRKPIVIKIPKDAAEELKRVDVVPGPVSLSKQAGVGKAADEAYARTPVAAGKPPKGTTAYAEWEKKQAAKQAEKDRAKAAGKRGGAGSKVKAAAGSPGKRGASRGGSKPPAGKPGSRDRAQAAKAKGKRGASQQRGGRPDTGASTMSAASLASTASWEAPGAEQQPIDKDTEMVDFVEFGVADLGHDDVVTLEFASVSEIDHVPDLLQESSDEEDSDEEESDEDDGAAAAALAAQARAARAEAEARAARAKAEADRKSSAARPGADWRARKPTEPAPAQQRPSRSSDASKAPASPAPRSDSKTQEQTAKVDDSFAVEAASAGDESAPPPAAAVTAAATPELQPAAAAPKLQPAASASASASATATTPAEPVEHEPETPSGGATVQPAASAPGAAQVVAPLSGAEVAGDSPAPLEVREKDVAAAAATAAGLQDAGGKEAEATAKVADAAAVPARAAPAASADVEAEVKAKHAGVRQATDKVDDVRAVATSPAARASDSKDSPVVGTTAEASSTRATGAESKDSVDARPASAGGADLPAADPFAVEVDVGGDEAAAPTAADARAAVSPSGDADEDASASSAADVPKLELDTAVRPGSASTKGPKTSGRGFSGRRSSRGPLATGSPLHRHEKKAAKRVVFSPSNSKKGILGAAAKSLNTASLIGSVRTLMRMGNKKKKAKKSMPDAPMSAKGRKARSRKTPTTQGEPGWGDDAVQEEKQTKQAESSAGDAADGATESKSVDGDDAPVVREAEPFEVSTLEPALDANDFVQDPYHSDDEIEQTASRVPPAVWILGKPGVGKTSVASRVAGALKAEYIEPSAVVEAAVNEVRAADNGDAEAKGGEDDAEGSRAALARAARAALEGGDAVPEKVLLGLVRAAVVDARERGRPVVIDGFPLSSTDFAHLTEGMSDTSLLMPTHVVHLDLEDDDVEARREGFRVHPPTNDMYSGAELSRFSSPTDLPPLPPPRPVGGGDDEDGEDGGGDGGDGDELGRAGVLQLPKPRPAPLVARPLDERSRVHQQLDRFAHDHLHPDKSHIVVSANQPADDVFEEVMIALGEAFPPRSRLPAAPVAHRLPLPDDVASADVITQRQYLLYADIPELRARGDGDGDGGDGDDAGGDGDGDDGETGDAEERARKADWAARARLAGARCKVRYWSRWRGMCPVALAEHGTLEDGQLRHAAEYRGRVFLLSSEERLARFVRDPRPFLRTPPRLPANQHVAVAGPLRSGVSTVANTMAQQLQLEVVDVAAVVKARLGDGTAAGEAIKAHLELGEVVPPAVVAHVVAEAVGIKPPSIAVLQRAVDGKPAEEAKDESKAAADGGDGDGGEGEGGDGGNADGDGDAKAAEGPEDAEPFISEEARARGWVLDGFPTNKAGALAMVAAGLKPDVALVMDVQGDGGAQGEGAANPLKDASMDPLAADGAAVLPLRPSSAHWRGGGDGGGDLADIEAALSAEGVDVRKVQVGDEVGTPEVVAARARANVDPFFARVDPEAEAAGEPEAARTLGDTAHFDPVALEQGVLVPGKPELTARAGGKVYEFATPANKARFEAEPGRFTPAHEPEAPPPRVLLLAPRGADAALHAERVASQYGLGIVNAADEARGDAAWKAAAAEAAKQDPPEPEPPLPVDKVADALRAAYALYGAQGRGCMLADLGDTATAEQLRALTEAQVPPSAVVALQVPTDELVQRRMAREFRWSPPAPAVDPDADPDEDAPPPTTAEELAEMREAAEGEARERYAAEAEADAERIAAVVDTARELRLRVLPAIDGSGQTDRVFVRAVAALRPQLEGQDTPFSTAVPVSEALCAELLDSGRARVSKFGPYCPVARRDREVNVAVPSFPVSYRRHIYYLEDEDAVKRFCTNPHWYVHQPPAPGHVAPRAAVVGPPCSGKSTVAAALAQELGCVLVTPAAALEWAARPAGEGGGADSHLGRDVAAALAEGSALSGALVARAVVAFVATKDCVDKGWVMDGFPRTAAEATALDTHGVQPLVVLSLQAPEPELMQRAARREQQARRAALAAVPVPPTFDAAQVLAALADYNLRSGGLASFYLRRYENLRGVDAARSKWAVGHAAVATVRQVVRHNEAHAAAVRAGAPARIADVLLPASEIISRQGFMREYCPVAWATRRELRPSVGGAGRRYGVEWRGKFYHCCGEPEARQFLAQPSRYLYRQRLPRSLPFRVPLGREQEVLQSRPIGLGGYCPVEMQRTPGWAGLVGGDPHLAVTYDGRVWLFSTEDKLHAFLRTPQRFARQELPVKLPPRALKVAPEELLVRGSRGDLGYLEQGLSNVVVQALESLGTVRASLRHPALPSVAASAQAYVALFLLANNPNATPEVRERQRRRLGQFVDECGIGPQLKQQTPRGAGASAVRGAGERRKLGQRFDALRQEGRASLLARLVQPGLE